MINHARHAIRHCFIKFEGSHCYDGTHQARLTNTHIVFGSSTVGEGPVILNDLFSHWDYFQRAQMINGVLKGGHFLDLLRNNDKQKLAFSAAR